MAAAETEEKEESREGGGAAESDAGLAGWRAWARRGLGGRAVPALRAPTAKEARQRHRRKKEPSLSGRTTP